MATLVLDPACADAVDLARHVLAVFQLVGAGPQHRPHTGDPTEHLLQPRRDELVGPGKHPRWSALVELQFGYLVAPSFLLRLYVSGAVHETTLPDLEILYSGGLLEAVYLFHPGESFRPYVFGGLGGFAAESTLDDFTYSMEGPGASFGAGLYYHFTPYVSLHSSVRIEAVNWETAKVSVGAVEIEVPVDESGSAAKFTLGLGFWF